MNQLKWVALALVVIMILIPLSTAGAQDNSPITDDEVAQLRRLAADAEPFFTL